MTSVSDISLNDSNYIRVLDHGFVGLVDHMGDDNAIVQAARVSYGKGTKQVSEDRGLIRYLLRHRHTTPFEMVDFKFHLKLPIFVMRQHIRHRTASVNEYSGRYSQMTDEFYIPKIENLKKQSKSNKQGRDEELDIHAQKWIQSRMADSFEQAYEDYETLISEEIDLARELARNVLPVANYTECYWKINLHNLFHYLSLRMDSHAQWEIQEYAKTMFKLIQPIVPMACDAFEDYVLHAETFSRQELLIVKNFLRETDIDQYLVGGSPANLSKRELEEFKKKLSI